MKNIWSIRVWYDAYFDKFLHTHYLGWESYQLFSDINFEKKSENIFFHQFEIALGIFNWSWIVWTLIMN